MRKDPSTVEGDGPAFAKIIADFDHLPEPEGT